MAGLDRHAAVRVMRALTLAGLASLLTAQARADDLDSLVAKANPSAPGCAVGVSRQGQPTQFRARGLADLEHGVPITPETIFEAGSVSKQFTAAAVLTLVQDGKIKLSDDIRKYLPEMPGYGAPITIDHLLSHTSGLRDWGEVAALAGWPRGSRVYTNDEALWIASRQTALNYPLGSAYSYTNTGYSLAALIVARVSGQSFADFTRDRLFKPLGMTHSQWRDDFTRIVPGRAQAYEPGPGGQQLDMPFEDGYGNGGLLTTVGDLLIWNDALTKGALGAAVTERMQQQAVLTGGRKIEYARGLFITAYHDVREISHSGATGGYRAWLGRYPDQGLSIAVLCNAGDADAGRQAHEIANLYLPPAPTAAPSAEPTSAGELAQRPGLYVQEGAVGLLRLAAEGDHLRQLGGPSLAPAGPGRYRAGAVLLVFRPNGDLERRSPDGSIGVFHREPPAHPTPAELGAIVGTYASEEANATIRIGLRAGKLVVIPADRPSAAALIEPLFKDGFSYPGGGVIRVTRGVAGQVEGFRYQGGRVWDFAFRRVGS
ncbi:serine hydrolase domain-containing protein [Phenylobacterium sp.]|uniref:serine hydrolase domain-containing protein n=1 Tax=Phenylobacterium sp. TaxID=1871053 RepID=UPI0011FC923C|nr:serine hydrolase domain-containing protein [Phenylobacterium sp.]THD55447.1 MAG: class A beta-lactamase-related serine hydrolase [Phenylobacterium sp.]